jgi:hypothetical protein
MKRTSVMLMDICPPLRAQVSLGKNFIVHSLLCPNHTFPFTEELYFQLSANGESKTMDW